MAKTRTGPKRSSAPKKGSSGKPRTRSMALDAASSPVKREAPGKSRPVSLESTPSQQAEIQPDAFSLPYRLAALQADLVWRSPLSVLARQQMVAVLRPFLAVRDRKRTSRT